MASDFDHVFGDWWKNDGISPAHRKWSNWYFGDYDYISPYASRPRPYDYADRAWQQRFEDMKTSIREAIKPRSAKAIYSASGQQTAGEL